MEHAFRAAFNQNFTQEAYDAFTKDVFAVAGGELLFRLCETPLFLSQEFSDELVAAATELVAPFLDAAFLKRLDAAVPPDLYVPNEDAHPLFLQLDFAVAESPNGGYIPQLIELQGFPTLYAFQWLLDSKIRKHFQIPDTLTPYFSGLNEQTYLELLRRSLLGDAAPDHVVLLEIEPQKQKTMIDFICTEQVAGIKTVDLCDVIKRGRKLFYKSGGKEIPIERIYNRVIFDELVKKDIQFGFRFQDDLDVVWLNHPNWFMKISKYCLPLLKSRYAPPAFFLHALDAYPDDLENYVLKPLFSFSGAGVEVDVTKDILDAVADRENYILQRKVTYAPAVQTPEGGTKVEVRMMFLWHEKPMLVNNLVRMSRGKLLGASYNRDNTWVGASIAYHP